MLQASFGSRMGNTNDQGVCQLKNIPPGEWSVVINDYKISSDGADADEAAKKINEDAAKILDEGDQESRGERRGQGHRSQGGPVEGARQCEVAPRDLPEDQESARAVAPEQEASVRIELDR